MFHLLDDRQNSSNVVMFCMGIVVSLLLFSFDDGDGMVHWH